MTELLSIQVQLFGHGPAFPREVRLVKGRQLREMLRELGLFPEGCSTWWNGEPVPLDFAPAASGTLEIVQTFSGG